MLTDRRLVFGTAKHGILVDLMVDQIKAPVIVRHRFMMPHLTTSDLDETVRTFVVNKRSAQALAGAINRGHPDGPVTLPGSFRVTPNTGSEALHGSSARPFKGFQRKWPRLAGWKVGQLAERLVALTRQTQGPESSTCPATLHSPSDQSLSRWCS